MISNDAEILKLKNKIKMEVCKLAWQDNLNQDAVEQMILDLFPGPKATWRCCVYKEREIVRQRVRLAMCENVTTNPNSQNIVQVIEPACDECPIATYMVTDMCRFCLGKACLNACKFDALTPGDSHMKIDPAKCRECGMCANVCPYGAIIHIERPCKKACPVDAITYDEYGIAQIDEEKCVNCGHCIHNCPFGAIGSKVFLVKIIDAIKSGKQVIAMVAPSIEGQFGEKIDLASIKRTLQKIGFSDMVEVGLGADMTAASESLEWIEALEEGKKLTTSCCPAFTEMLRKNFPEIYENNKSKTVSPMCATARYLKVLYPDCVTVFIGPCVAKKKEALDESIEDNADFVMTYGELQILMESLNLDFIEADEHDQQSSIFGKGFASSGGVANAVLEVMKERGENVDDVKLLRCSGGSECRKGVLLLKHGRLTEDFIEGMFCPGGCVGGPSKRKTETEITRARKKQLDKADDRGILENLATVPMDQFSMSVDYHKEK